MVRSMALFLKRRLLPACSNCRLLVSRLLLLLLKPLVEDLQVEEAS